MSSDFWSRRWLLDQYNRTTAAKPRAPIPAKPLPYLNADGSPKWRVEAHKPKIKAKTRPQSR
jgi:hypothetical protein